MGVLSRLLNRLSLKSFPGKSAICFYTISWGWLFYIRDSIWSDDWDLFAFRRFTTYNFDDFGIAPWREIDLLLYEYFGAPSLRALTFLCFLSASVFVHGITAKMSNLSLSQRQAIALLFLVLPFNSARISLMVVSSALAYFYFFLAWYLLVNFKGKGIKAASLLLFFLSFGLASNLFFYLFPIAHYFIRAGVRNWSDFLPWVRRNTLFITLPPIYAFCRNIFWPQKNGYWGYGFTDLFGLIWTAPLFILILLVYVLGRKFFSNSKSALNLIVAGLLMMLVTSLPYIIYGAYRCCQISFVEDYLAFLFGRRGWESRHQILQPLGVAFFLVGLVSFLPSVTQKLRGKIIGLILIISILINLNFGLEAFTEYSKQLEVVDTLETSGDFNLVELYVVRDETPNLNFLANGYSSKMWAGLIATATDPSVYRWFEIIPGVGLSEKLVIECHPPEKKNREHMRYCQSAENSKAKMQNRFSRLVWIRGPSTRLKAIGNLLSDGEIGFNVQVIDFP